MIAPVMIWCLLAGTSAVTVVQEPRVLSIPEGERAKMSCEMREDEIRQILHYYWYLNSMHPACKLENSTTVTIMSGTLIIFPVTTNDTGIYICSVVDYKVQDYHGEGTHLLVQESTKSQDDKPTPDKYLYYFLFIIPLLMIIVIFWRFTFSSTTGAKTQDRKRRNKKRRRKKDNGEELLYSTIFPQPQGAHVMEQVKSRNKSEEEVEYACVRMAASSLTFSYTQETSSTDNVVYASLKTEES